MSTDEYGWVRMDTEKQTANLIITPPYNSVQLPYNSVQLPYDSVQLRTTPYNSVQLPYNSVQLRAGGVVIVKFEQRSRSSGLPV